jgi:choline kinase
MRAIILSAGQGKRLLPLTEHTPKCLLTVQDGTSLLEFQLQCLAACGVEQASVMVGFGAELVEEQLAKSEVDGIEVRTIYNPFYHLSDNLATAWLAQSEMTEDFLLLNGDTLFEPEVLQRLLDSPEAPLTLTINVKDRYDDDDMKVRVDAAGRLRAVGKTLPLDGVDGESIGLMLFRGAGVSAFRAALEDAIRGPEGLKRWYLSVVDSLAATTRVMTTDISGIWWGEVDWPEDLSEVRKALSQLDPPPRPSRSQRPAG